MEAETYPMPKDGWTCFHCGDNFTTPGAARDHFGGEPKTLAGCQIKAGQERGLLMELRKAEARAIEWEERAIIAEAEVESLEYRVEGQLSEIRSYKPFSKCRSIREIFNLYDTMEGRALAAEERRVASPHQP